MDDDKLHDDERPKIKVTDRRKFTAEGEVRDDAAEETSSAAPATEVPAADAPESSPGEDATVEATPDVSPDDAAPQPAGGDAASSEAPGEDGDDPRIAAAAPSMADLPRDFSAFVESIYLEAMLYMGAMPHPATGEVVEDLDLARYKIDILSMLVEKTDGNLSPQEKQQLDEILYQLRMVFVQKGQ